MSTSTGSEPRTAPGGTRLVSVVQRTRRPSSRSSGQPSAGLRPSARAETNDPPGAGLLSALYVDPAHWSRGIGRALIQEARARLGLLGFGEASVWVLVGNERADRFYRRDGWASDGSGRLDEVWGLTVEEVRYGRSLR